MVYVTCHTDIIIEPLQMTFIKNGAEFISKNLERGIYQESHQMASQKGRYLRPNQKIRGQTSVIFDSWQVLRFSDFGIYS